VQAEERGQRDELQKTRREIAEDLFQRTRVVSMLVMSAKKRARPCVMTALSSPALPPNLT